MFKFKLGYWSNFATKLHGNGAYGTIVPIHNSHTKHVFPGAFFSRFSVLGRQVAFFSSSLSRGENKKKEAEKEPAQCDSYFVLKIMHIFV